MSDFGASLPSSSQLAPGIRRLVAPNPSMMTGPGTNTYLFGNDEVAVLDPGPVIDHLVVRPVEAPGEQAQSIDQPHGAQCGEGGRDAGDAQTGDHVACERPTEDRIARGDRVAHQNSHR